MTIRFLQTCESERPGMPFMAGQTITVDAPSPFLLSLLDGVRAEVVRTDNAERAVEPAAETPEPVETKRGRRRAG
jgi:hypothetical protein